MHRRQRVDIFDVAYAFTAATRVEFHVKRRIARARRCAGVVKRPVDDKPATAGQSRARVVDECFHRRPRQDVQRVRAENAVEHNIGPARCHIKNQRSFDIRDRVRGKHRADTVFALFDVRAYPAQPRHAGGEMHGMLARSAADFEYSPVFTQQVFKARKYRRLVALRRR